MSRSILCAALIAFPLPVAADSDWEDGQDRYEQQIILNAEIERANAVGGYTNPFSALIQLFSGTGRDEDIQRPITDISQVPESALPGAD